ncbi:SusC/RagA family TonB-linked outer membrane protein [Flavobacterium pectinovorum]|uniref:SusC/RagA family TonB-linked outer membrane protein n=1 Tax=Flavobacterium pectinovorum TaxID=29533 RepID=UPI001FADDF45|nr:SusC/RagA family TonB-linked outer membrane protein [Flavobacterium pectinovorum]MCI9843585.1 SusC/RagA family TonB-linked outer membrane protein [Flavobacterium pectinovorum]
MRKIFNNLHSASPRLFLTMKRGLLFGLLLLNIFITKAENKIIFQTSINLKDVKVERVLNELENNTSYKFVYKIEDVDLNRIVSIKISNAKIETILNELFKNTGTSFRIAKNHIFLSKKSVTEIQPKSSDQDAIKGKVTDEKGLPVPGVNVYFETALTSTLTDQNGEFRIQKEPLDDVLVFKALGFITYKTSLGDKTEINVEMKQDITELSEVAVVVNTGMSKRALNSYTGAATTITGAEIKQISATNVFSAITAIDPSVRIAQNNIAGGNINNLPKVNIRGTNSFPNLTGELSADPNTPLIILDGFEVDIERIYDLDINLINNITILKDASATAIYGSRGANGVMVFTTKTPEPGKLRVTLINDFNIMTPDLSVYNYLNSSQKLDFENRIGIYTKANPDNQYVYSSLYNYRLKSALSGVDTDWAKIPVQNGYGNQTSLYLQGGDEKIRYGAQVSADFQNGVMKKQDRNNFTGQFDFSYRTNKLKFSNSLRVFQNKANESPYGNFEEYLRLNPYWAPYDENGTPKMYLESYTIANRTFTERNPLYDATLNSVNSSGYFGFSNNFQFQYKILPSLFLESNFSINRRNSQSDQFFSGQDSRFEEVTDISRKGSYTKTNTDTNYFENLTTLNFNLRRNKHQFYSMLGLNLSSSTTEYYTFVAEGFPYDKLDNLLFAAQYELNGKPTGDESTIRRVGFVYSGSYSYDERFLVDVSLRRDGSSQYGTDKRFGTFWSAGLGWNIHNEAIFKDKEWINRLKIRGSYGSTGSTNIPAYGAQTRYSYGVETLYNGSIGTSLENLGNKSLSWQNVYKFNVGIDAVLFNSRLDTRFDFYIEDTKDALTQVTLAPSSGFATYSENLGSIRNKGFEFSVRYKLINNRTENIFWSIYANGYTNNNILKKLSNKLQSSNNNLNELNTAQTVPNVLFEEGQSINTIYAVRSLGVDPVTGSEVYLKKDGTQTYEWDAKDKVAVGVTDPKWRGNFGTNFMYKGFEIGLIFDYTLGGELYNQTLVDRVESVNPQYNVDIRAYNLGWSQPGDVSPYTRITEGKAPTKVTSRFVQEDNTINMLSGSLAYNFNKKNYVLEKLGMSSLKMTFIANDVARWSSIEIERGTANPYARAYSLSMLANF